MSVKPSASDRLTGAAITLLHNDRSYAGHPDRVRIVGASLQTYQYWYWRVAGFGPREAKAHAIRNRRAWANGEWGWEAFSSTIADARYHAATAIPPR